MPYCTEAQVWDALGMTTARFQSITGKSSSQVTSLIDDYITWSEQTIKDWVRLPIVVRTEYHKGDGENHVWDLGPEDEEFSVDYDPTDDVEKVFAVYLNNRRTKLPYPKDDCDLGCENESSDWGVSNCTITDESSTIACGSFSIEGVFTASGYMQYPSAQDLNKNIDIYDWIAFQFRTSDASLTYTVRLYDKDDNNNNYDFTVDKADIWYWIMIKVDDFSGTVDWETTKLYYLELRASGACTVYIDNLNFNDDFCWTIPQGDIVYMMQETPVYTTTQSSLGETDEIEVTYSYDPFNTTVPDNIQEACACLVGAKMIEHVMGYREQFTAFTLDSEDANSKIDKLSLQITKSRLKKRAEELVGQWGYGFDSGVI